MSKVLFLGVNHISYKKDGEEKEFDVLQFAAPGTKGYRCLSRVYINNDNDKQLISKLDPVTYFECDLSESRFKDPKTGNWVISYEIKNVVLLK